MVYLVFNILQSSHGILQYFNINVLVKKVDASSMFLQILLDTLDWHGH